ncbi:glycoside hydrolase family 73 protein [Chondrinema litorale]|uniref:glycoside hydrolase family 73 protein n=1 Tax=Chondrinema litorale TaxID=2994555 RepID=UPI002542F99A|nr:glucosaminidase domain-containing protein [Chondrinema litorale]UZS00076.1 glucosaminidase domain-containing protein [Chondrinema litorale]
MANLIKNTNSSGICVPKVNWHRIKIGLILVSLLLLLISISSYDSSLDQDNVQEKIITEISLEVKHNNPSIQTLRKGFLKEKNRIVLQYLNQYGVGRVDQLAIQEKKDLHRSISLLFKQKVLGEIDIESHVYQYFTDTMDLNKLETALMEQATYNIPASIKLAQSALETGYGSRIINNNYFGIKDKTGNVEKSTTTEYYTLKEVKKYSHKILSKQLIKKNGRSYYKCLVKDSFEKYDSPWFSFRAHSRYLTSNKRYAPLFVGGKKFDAWADKIGSEKSGGVGYATSLEYGELLKAIIQRYNLDLLDF